MKREFATLLIAALATLFSPAVVLAQDEPAQADAQPAAQDDPQTARENADAPKEVDPQAGDEPASPARPKAQAWKKALTQWKELLASLRSLREEFVNAETKDLDRIRKEYDDLRGQGAKKLADLKQAARDAFVEAPNEDRELARFLVQLSAQAVRQDRYEEGYEVAMFFIDNGGEDKAIYNWAGIAAYGTNRFGQAKKYLDMAAEAGVVTSAPDADGESAHASIDEVLAAWPEEEAFRAAEAKADDLPRVRLKTSQGDIVVELFENEAPDTVGNFVSLVEKGFYDNREFFRVLPGFMAQVGSPTDDGTGGPGYNIYCECYKTPHRNHFAGSLSMAKQQPRDTGGSQFYLTFAPTPHLNGKHTVFGRVIEGMEVLAEIQRFDPDKQKANQPKPKFDKIIEATVERKRDHEYKPNKVK